MISCWMDDSTDQDGLLLIDLLSPPFRVEDRNVDCYSSRSLKPSPDYLTLGSRPKQQQQQPIAHGWYTLDIECKSVLSVEV